MYIFILTYTCTIVMIGRIWLICKNCLFSDNLIKQLHMLTIQWAVNEIWYPSLSTKTVK